VGTGVVFGSVTVVGAGVGTGAVFGSGTVLGTGVVVGGGTAVGAGVGTGLFSVQAQSVGWKVVKVGLMERVADSVCSCSNK